MSPGVLGAGLRLGATKLLGAALGSRGLRGSAAGQALQPPQGPSPWLFPLLSTRSVTFRAPWRISQSWQQLEAKVQEVGREAKRSQTRSRCREDTGAAPHAWAPPPQTHPGSAREGGEWPGDLREPSLSLGLCFRQVNDPALRPAGLYCNQLSSTDLLKTEADGAQVSKKLLSTSQVQRGGGCAPKTERSRPGRGATLGTGQ